LLDLRGIDESMPDAADCVPGLLDMLDDREAAWIATIRPPQLRVEGVRRLIHDYCHDFVSLPCDEALLTALLGHALGMASLLPPPPRARAGDAPVEGMVGRSEPMQRMAERLRKAARCDAPVFLHGETGTGKELAAVALHRQSARSQMPFVGINCGAIPPSLMQSELFGYERGAFTGANQRKPGRIELAHRGTLFLDEIGDLPMESQASLLRFLEQGTIERLGGQGPLRVDARIVSATHTDLHQAIEEGRFRADLFHRLRVIELQIPSLRERCGDVVLIARHAMQCHAGEGRGQLKGFAPCALRALRAYDWPGNVRELINRVREAMVMVDGRHITAADLRLDNADRPADACTLGLARRDGERTAIEHALSRNGHRTGAAAKELGISRVTLYRLMLRHGLQERGEAGAIPARGDAGQAMGGRLPARLSAR